MTKRTRILLTMLLGVTLIAGSIMPIRAESDNHSDGTVLKSETLIGFENRKQALASIRLSGVERAEFCEDSNYITEGTHCLHICPSKEEIEDGTYYKDAMVVFYPDKGTYLDTEYIALDVYNPTEYVQTAVFTFGEVCEEYKIEPGESTIWCYIDRARLDYYSKGVIRDFRIKFRGENKETGPLDVYLDNFRCYYANVEYEKYVNDFSQNAWYSFENTGDLANIMYHGTKVSDFSQPVFNINRDIRYIKSGTGSLQVDFRNTLSGAQDTRMFRTRDNKLGDLNQYLDNLEDYYIGFPVYNPTDSDITCSVTIFSNYNDEAIGVSTTIPAGSWSDSDFVVPLADMKAKFSGAGFDVMTVAFSIGGLPGGGTIYLDSIGVYPFE